jgi:hypothetical protein
MNSQLAVRVTILFLALIISSFDRHLSGYFPDEVKMLVQADAIPLHSDVPVKYSDHHEDIVFKALSDAVPAPLELPVCYKAGKQKEFMLFPPDDVWQPPEFRS